MNPLDIAVIAVYLVLMAGVGFWFMRRNKDADAYFRAGGRLPWWVVSLSIYATMFSSITFMSVPAMSFSGDMSYFGFHREASSASLRISRHGGLSCHGTTCEPL